jgi:hypothetical protein
MFLATVPDVRGVQITRSGLAKASGDEQAVHGPAGPDSRRLLGRIGQRATRGAESPARHPIPDWLLAAAPCAEGTCARSAQAG